MGDPVKVKKSAISEEKYLLLIVCLVSMLQGHPTQTVFFKTALTDRNIKVKFALKLVLEC